MIIAGGGATAEVVIAGHSSQAARIKIIESDRRRTEELTALFPRHGIVHGDAADMSVLASGGWMRRPSSR
ncbi:MAG: hypothetical protein GY910_22300 [bacterium]|nr:hypothetical protein [bacterium]